VGVAAGTVLRGPSDCLRWMVRFLGVAALVCAAAAAAGAQQIRATLDPAATQINFTLAATLHTVHGTFKLKSGQMQWDAATGHTTGAIVIDATSGTTDNASRDKNMQNQVLESAKFPEITFTPSQIKGTLNKEGTSQLEVAGVIRIHGQDHDQTLKLAVEHAAGTTLEATTQFLIPYVKWGIKDPSTFLLHVADTVNVEIQAAANIQ
jgi:polyisoprenoid-binding protein YceI